MMVYGYNMQCWALALVLATPRLLVRTKKSDARRGGAKVRKKAQWQWLEIKKPPIRAILIKKNCIKI